MRPDSFDHRTVEAVGGLTGKETRDPSAFFPGSTVRVTSSADACQSWEGQLLVASALEQLIRFNRVLHEVQLDLPMDTPQVAVNQLNGSSLRDGIIDLQRRIRPEMRVTSERPFEADPSVTLCIGPDVEGSDVQVAGTDWRAYLNHSEARLDANRLPFGPLLASSLGVAEVFKRLLIEYHPDTTESRVKLAENLVFSPLSLGRVDADPDEGTPRDPVDVGRVWIAGLGGGGSAALYALTAVPDLQGIVTGIDNDQLEESNGNRHLYATRNQLEDKTPKPAAAADFVQMTDASFQFGPVQATLPDPLREVDNPPDMLLSMVDTVPARRSIQQWYDGPIVEAGVGGQVEYSLLRVWPGEGMCLGCKHPFEPNERDHQTARTWGLDVERVAELDEESLEVTPEMVSSLARVQQRDTSNFEELIGRLFDEVRREIDCGELDLDLRPGFSPTLPFLTAMPGFLAAAEAVKRVVAPEMQLYNRYRHNMLWVPDRALCEFRPPREDCAIGCA